jgi:hypothetical protein
MLNENFSHFDPDVAPGFLFIGDRQLYRKISMSPSGAWHLIGTIKNRIEKSEPRIVIAVEHLTPENQTTYAKILLVLTPNSIGWTCCWVKTN